MSNITLRQSGKSHGLIQFRGQEIKWNESREGAGDGGGRAVWRGRRGPVRLFASRCPTFPLTEPHSESRFAIIGDLQPHIEQGGGWEGGGGWSESIAEERAWHGTVRRGSLGRSKQFDGADPAAGYVEITTSFRPPRARAPPGSPPCRRLPGRPLNAIS